MSNSRLLELKTMKLAAMFTTKVNQIVEWIEIAEEIKSKKAHYLSIISLFKCGGGGRI
jgi:hypothetical protein